MELIKDTKELFYELISNNIECKKSLDDIFTSSFNNDEEINNRLNEFYTWYTRNLLSVHGIYREKKDKLDELEFEYKVYIANAKENILTEQRQNLQKIDEDFDRAVATIKDSTDEKLEDAEKTKDAEISIMKNSFDSRIKEINTKIIKNKELFSKILRTYSWKSKKIQKGNFINIFAFPSRKRNLLKKFNLETAKKIIDSKIEIKEFNNEKIEEEKLYTNKYTDIAKKFEDLKSQLELKLLTEINSLKSEKDTLKNNTNMQCTKKQDRLKEKENNELMGFSKIKVEKLNEIEKFNQNLKLSYENMESLILLPISGSHYNILPFNHSDYDLFNDIEKNMKAIDQQRKYSAQYFIPIGKRIFNKIRIPLLIPFIHSNNIIFNYQTENGKKALSDLIDSIMFRTLLTLPNGKTHFTFIDPNGMGENCSKLLGLNHEMYGKVYVGESEIDEQMNNLSSFVAYVNTKYLRHEYKDIKEYNKGIGEVEEPYKIMAAYDFPDNFRLDSLKKLKGIMQNGTRTGIQTLLLKELNASKEENSFTIEEQKKVIDDLENLAIIITERDGHFEIENLPQYNQNYLSHLEITEDMLIGQKLSVNITSYLNKKYETVDDIKVSYKEQVKDLLENKTFWTKDASLGIEANMGKNGRENQYFKINNKIEAHALLIGRSGSGKSNLLHMIITDLALNYSPELLHLYLIDMKGGIEFIRYIEHNLPHAKVASVTSDREMAYSILVGLEKELQRREELFSSKGVQEIAGYNTKFKDEKIPRILLILDEFQELFSKEDFIKRQSSDIFDRLAKKGRSFGMNMLLSSQSLGGETISSATLHQFAVRILLQCSEDDSSRALSSNNTDAKLLSRPGEGIYNSQNGHQDGNQRFQTYWMEDKEDKAILTEIEKYVDAQGVQYEQKIFREDIKPRYESYYSHIKADEHSLTIPLGQPFSLDDSVNIEFTQESGSNVFISGTNEEGAMNLLISIMSSLVLLKKRNFYILNTYAPNHPETQKLNNFIETIEDFDVQITILNNKNIEENLKNIENIIDINVEEISNECEDHYLMIFAPAKLRSFKKEGYSMSNSSMILDKIIRDGGEYNIHTIMYMETQKNLENMFEHSTRNYFQIVLALQMSNEDSNRLISSDIASSLGRDNALLCIEDINLIQKFRPLELSNDSWLLNKLNKLEEN